MTISYQWLQQYLPTPLPLNELTQILTSIGLEVEGTERMEAIRGGLEGLVIGEVLTCEKHPNADKLHITTVAVGADSPLHIVCGAPNVAAGQKVVVATVGTTVHPTTGTPFEIKKAKIRGADSEGMLCAEDEIGLGDSHAGIMVLPQDAPVGTTAKAYYNLPDAETAIHIGLTPNRSDANSHLGVARDVCAYLTHHRGGSYAAMQPAIQPATAAADPTIGVAISATDACPRYAGVEITGIQVAESPAWLKQRLKTIGLRSINNVVDITNYVLHEYGQPLHAFDADKIHGTITVKHLPEGTVFTGLDGTERKLRAEDIAICDDNGPLALGGVFGGANSGITASTTRVFLESAYFAPGHIRRTSLHHNLRTDAATHFEKGVDIDAVLPALHRAAQLIAQLAGGVMSNTIDVYPKPLSQPSVRIAYEYIHRLSGKRYSADTIKNILNALGFTIAAEEADSLTVVPPTNKTDIAQPADIVEELLRIDGLDQVAFPGRISIPVTNTIADARHLKERAAELLCGAGLTEILTNSIVNSKYYPDSDGLVKMINSLSAELDVMRPAMLESGLEVINYNCNRKNTDLQLFELGHVYHKTTEGYVQEARLAIWVTGNNTTANWNTHPTSTDVYYVKGLVTSLLEALGLQGISTATDASATSPTITLHSNGTLIGSISQVSAHQLKLFDIKQDVYHADIHWNAVQELASAQKVRYTEVPKFPAVQRDLAIVLDKQITYSQVLDVTQSLKQPSLKEFGLFDVFESEKLGADRKSLALSYTFQLHDRTLTDAETEQLMKQLSDAYAKHLNAQIR